MNLYIKIEDQYFPIEFDKVITKDWDNSLITVQVYGDPSDKDIDDIMEALEFSDALDFLDNSSFIFSPYKIKFKKHNSFWARIKNWFYNGKRLKRSKSGIKE